MHAHNYTRVREIHRTHFAVVLVEFFKDEQMFLAKARRQLVRQQIDVTKLWHGGRCVAKELLVLLLGRRDAERRLADWTAICQAAAALTAVVRCSESKTDQNRLWHQL